MPLRSEPTARQLRLATELRRLRDAAGLSAREAAKLLGVSPPHISQIESGHTGVSESRLRRLASNYACSDPELIDALVAMATDRTRGWWEEYRNSLPAPFLDLAELEHHSTYRSDVEFLFIPGLLQTDDYARAAFSSRVPELSEEQLELRVRHRIQRRVILEEPAPVPYKAIVHEAALRVRLGDRATSRAQLARVLELSEADHITVQVTPFDLDHFGGSWTPMMLSGGAVPSLDTAAHDARHGTRYINDQTQLGILRTLFRRVEAVSLDTTRSRDVIRRIAKEL
ncbi:helix-turn-helix transcriptional regulator [Streptomyces sp. NPDC059477]|uniref:helix-turn-helix domain-containing protein n=1 Tax=Streptomyces sp. NPDC059477 TaxID=3346847 RepID=UPI0036926152